MAFVMMGSKMAVLSEASDTKYCQIYNLPSQYVAEAIRLTKVFDSAVGSDLKFNLSLAQSAAQSAGLSIQTVLDMPIAQHNGTTTQLFDSFTRDLKAKYGMVLSPPLAESASKVFTNAFTNMRNEHSGAWIFWSKDSSTGTAYQYRTLYATTASVSGKTMVTVTPLSLNVSISVTTERVLCHVSKTTDFSVLTQGLVASEQAPATSAPAAAFTAEAFAQVPARGLEVHESKREEALEPFRAAGFEFVKMMDIPD